MLFSKKNTPVPLKSIKGAPYFNEKFSKGTIHQKNKIVSNKLYFRYNAFADEIEIGTHPNQKTTEESLLKKNELFCQFGGKTFYYLPHINKNEKIKLGYLISLHRSNKHHLFLQLKKQYREATTPRTSLERAFPPRFTEEKNLYLGEGNQTPVYIGNRVKKVIKKLPNEIKLTAKKHGINLKEIKNIEQLTSVFLKIK